MLRNIKFERFFMEIDKKDLPVLYSTVFWGLFVVSIDF